MHPGVSVGNMRSMTENELAFPVLCQHKGTLFTSGRLESLTRTTSAALRGGLFDGLRMIDSTGKEVMVESARKLFGVGLIWGFNVFLNQRIRVALSMRVTGKTFSPVEVRAIDLRDFRTWHGWQSRGDFEGLKEAIERTESIIEILRLLVTA